MFGVFRSFLQAFTTTGSNLNLNFSQCLNGYSEGSCDFGKEPGKVRKELHCDMRTQSAIRLKQTAATACAQPTHTIDMFQAKVNLGEN